jgi:flagellar basal-body rod modification protein FlgD
VSTVSATTATTAATTSTSSTTSSNTTLGKDDFMTLLIAEMKNQDPMNPMDGTEYAAQLAQFSSLEQLSNLNTNITDMISANLTLVQSVNNTMAATMIGREVKIDSADITVNDQDSIGLGIDLSANASSVIFKIYDSSGTLVKTIEEDDLSQGENKLSWDLTDNSGDTVSNGSYTYTVEATSSTGATMSDTGYQIGTITGVKYTDSGTMFMINGSEFDLSSILEILNTTTTE